MNSAQAAGELGGRFTQYGLSVSTWRLWEMKYQGKLNGEALQEHGWLGVHLLNSKIYFFLFIVAAVPVILLLEQLDNFEGCVLDASGPL